MENSLLLLDVLIEQVCSVCKITIDELKGPCRKREIIDARKIYAYLAVKHVDCTKTVMGERINFDRTNINHHSDDCPGLMKFDKQFAAKVEKVEEIFNMELV